MSFEVVEFEPGRALVKALEEGQCSLDRRGVLTARSADLDLVGITDRVMVLVDEASMRIAIREPRDGEADKSWRVSLVKGKGSKETKRRRINIGKAIELLRLDAEALRGRYDMMTKGDLLIVALVDPSVSDNA